MGFIEVSFYLFCGVIGTIGVIVGMSLLSSFVQTKQVKKGLQKNQNVKY